MNTQDTLKQRQALPLDTKIALSKTRIKKFVRTYEPKNCYISTSGGVDSIVLEHLVLNTIKEDPFLSRKAKSIDSVFFDTGLEFPCLKECLRMRERENTLVEIKPKQTFLQTLQKYGVPFISKEVAQRIRTIRSNINCNSAKCWILGIDQKTGNKSNFQFSGRYRFLFFEDFKISDLCCGVMKKSPAKSIKKKAIIGVLAEESLLRKESYVKHGCNILETGKEQSRPLMFWTKKDIWEYIERYKLQVPNIYTQGAERTGCMLCLFGIQHEDKFNNRMHLLKRTYPKIWKYAIEKLNYDKYLGLIGVDDGTGENIAKYYDEEKIAYYAKMTGQEFYNLLKDYLETGNQDNLYKQTQLKLF